VATSDSAAPNDDRAICAWCRSDLPTTPVAGGLRRRFCGRKCRQAAFRLRRLRGVVPAGATQLGVFRYADPPYPGLASKYYRDEASFAGEVDFPALIASLVDARRTGACLGWALSTSARSLRELLPLCPAEARVCAWVKPINASPRTYGLHNTWEPVIVVPGRRLRPGKRDWLRAMPARMEGSLPGRKPIAFCAWLFELLGMLPGDTIEDLYPGTGIVSRAWAELSSRSSATTSPEVLKATPCRSPRRTTAGCRRGPRRRVLESATTSSVDVATVVNLE